MSYIEDVLGDVLAIESKAASQKQAGDFEGKKAPPFAKKDKDDESDDDGDDDKGDDKDKDKGKDKGKDKEAGQADIFAKLASVHPELRDAANLEATTRVLADVKQAQLMGAFAQGTAPAQAPADPLAKLAALGVPAEQVRELFNYGYVDRLSKYASADPEFRAMLETEAAAFNAGFAHQMG